MTDVQGSGRFEGDRPLRVLLMAASMRGGGSEQQTLLLLRHLDRKRFSPQLFLQERAGDLLDQVPEDVKIHCCKGIQSGGFYFPGRILRRQVRHLGELVERESIDVIYDRTFHMTMIAGSAARAVAVPRVSTIVSPPERMLPMIESRFLALKRLRLARAYRQSRHVIAVSRSAAESAERFYRLPTDSVTVIPNPVDIESIRELAAGSSCLDELKRDSHLVLFCVGRMSEEKGHRDLIRAIALLGDRWPGSLPPIRLCLAGDGPLRGELQTLAEQDLGAHEIVFLGTRRRVAPLIAAADALVLPSLFEGMPNVVLEAMALGTPVIATRAGGTVELQRDKPTIGWANPNDPSSLAKAIVEFAMHRELAREQADSARLLVEDHHDVKLVTRQIEAILADV